MLFGQILIVVNGTNIEKIIKPSGHTWPKFKFIFRHRFLLLNDEKT